MAREIPLITFFELKESDLFKFVQLYVEKEGLVLPYMRFDGRQNIFHSDILGTMLRHHNINNFITRKIERGEIPELGGRKQTYHAIGMGLAIKDENDLYILDSESYDYGKGRDGEHFGSCVKGYEEQKKRIDRLEKINLIWETK